MGHRSHPLDPSRIRFQLPIGDQTGLTKTGVHLCHLPPNEISTVLHWHSHEDEWFYIIDAADDSVVLLREGNNTETAEVKISQGDFLGFPANSKRAHAFRSGSGTLVYLAGGSREDLDVSHYPEVGCRRITDRHGTDWIVNEDSVQSK